MQEVQNKSSPELTMLQAGRGIAALLVVLFHTTVLLESNKYLNIKVFGGLFEFGFAGVEFFFVLSGFIILHANRRYIGNPRSLKSYLFKRAIRVYPMYWIVITGLVGLLVISGGGRLSFLANSILLVGADTEAVLGVAWTLFHEIFFYLIFAVLLLNRSLGVAVVSFWLIACALWLNSTAPHYALSSINLLFGIGMAASILSGRLRTPSALWWVGAIGFMVIGYETVALKLFSEDIRELAFGLSAGLFVLGAVNAERLGNIRSPRFLQVLGDASYVLYLIHYPLLSLLGKIWLAVPRLHFLPVELLFGTMVVICVAAAIIVHLGFERPLLKFLAAKLVARR